MAALDVETGPATRLLWKAMPELSVSIPNHHHSQSADDLYNGGAYCDSLLTPSRPLPFSIGIEITPESMLSKPMAIKLLPSLPALKGRDRPTERIINRQALLEGAPDREYALLGTKNIEHLRQVLKIDTRWSQTDWKEYDGSTGPSPQSTSKHGDGSRSLTEPSNSQGQGKAGDTWPRRTLSSSQQLISLRPLGSTHILVISDTIQPNKKRVCIECPVNGLIFLVNCPNIDNPAVLARRTQGELLRVQIEVPHARLFTHLVTYFHTRDQVELFKTIIPRWLWELLRPLSFVSNPASPVSPDQQRSFFPPSSRPKTWTKFSEREESGLGVRTRTWLSSFSSGSGDDAKSAKSIALGSRSPSSSSLSLPSADISKSIANACNNGRDLDLMECAVRLHALRDNLEAIGLYTTDLWTEMQQTELVVIRAISLRAQVTALLFD